jgi:hypothetical protein
LQSPNTRVQSRRRVLLVECKSFERVVGRNVRKLLAIAGVFFGELNHFIEFIIAAKKTEINPAEFWN